MNARNFARVVCTGLFLPDVVNEPRVRAQASINSTKEIRNRRLNYCDDRQSVITLPSTLA